MLYSDRRPCAGCEGLFRSHDCEPPHEFLVLRRPGALSIYQCLVCHTNLEIDQHAEGGARWVAFLEHSEPLPAATSAEARMQTRH